MPYVMEASYWFLLVLKRKESRQVLHTRPPRGMASLENLLPGGETQPTAQSGFGGQSLLCSSSRRRSMVCRVGAWKSWGRGGP